MTDMLSQRDVEAIAARLFLKWRERLTLDDCYQITAEIINDAARTHTEGNPS